VISTLEKINPALTDPINQAMLLSNSSRPATRQHILQGFRFSDTSERVSQYGLDQLEDAKRYFPVCIYPVTQILAKFSVKYRFSVSDAGQGPSPGAAFPGAPACPFVPPPAAVR
jgi:hypothetical protein